MYCRSLILSLSVLPLLGWAVPTTTISRSTSTDDNDDSSSGMITVKIDASNNNILNTTRQAATENYFPDPSVHCSGRSLDDEGDTSWSTSLATAVASRDAEAGLYGSCDVAGDDVDGYGSLAFKSGTVQVYYCNHAFAAQGCSLNEYWRADDLINTACGAKGGGWVSISKWGKTIGRDPTNADGSFRSECGDSLHGPNQNFALAPAATPATNATTRRWS